MRILIASIMLVVGLLAREGVVKEIISENEIVLMYNGTPMRAKLAGIASFLTANQKAAISYTKREELQRAAKEFLGEHLLVGRKIKFIQMDNEGHGPKLIWVSLDDGRELNYQMVKEGFAVVDANDPYLLGSFYMRLKRAMAYAKKKRAGLWQDEAMKVLEHSPSYYGAKNRGVKKEEIVEYLLQKLKSIQN